MTMATPTTNTTDSKPAATNPASQRQTFSAQCSRGVGARSGCSGVEACLFLDMFEAGKTADRIIKTAGQMAEFECCGKQLEWQEL